MSMNATPRALEIIIVEQVRVWHGLRGTPSEQGAIEALSESITEYERLQRAAAKSAEQIALERAS